MPTVTNGHSFSAPPRWMTALEMRALYERAAMDATGPLLARLPHGDGHPVLVLPGFTADDRSTAPMRDLLRSLGYRTVGWGLGPNLGPTPGIVHGLVELFEGLAAEGEAISIVGWSLGGIYARELAYEYPGAVRQVITLGSPIQMVDGDQSAVSDLWQSLHGLYEMPTITRSREHLEDLDVQEHELPVPSTAVYTRTDGIVHWRTCLDHPGPHTENIEVHGSHCGLGFNPSVLLVVADRLTLAHGEWRPFKAPLWLQGLYPRPATFRPRLDPQPVG